MPTGGYGDTAGDTFKANCVREYESCLELGEVDEPECRAFAEETCAI